MWKDLDGASAKETVDTASEPVSFLRFACPACGRKFATKPELVGKKVRCSGCGAGVRVPEADGSPAAPSSRPALKTYGATDQPRTRTLPAQKPAERAVARPVADQETGTPSSLLDDLTSIEGVKRPRRAEAVLPSRSETMERVLQTSADPEGSGTSRTSDPARKKTKKKKKKKASGYFDPKETLILVGGVSALVAVLAFFAWGYPDFRFPLGGLLCVVGFIVYLLGAVSLRQVVAEEGFVQLLLFRLCPPYQWWFVATHWEETRDFVSFFGAGLLILSIGGVVIKSSPIGKEAEASERAFQKATRGKSADVPPPVMKRIAREAE